MAGEECQALTKAFSGLGVDEKSIISTIGKWRPEQTNSFRKACEFFAVDGHYHAFEKWDGSRIKQLELEFLRLKEAVVLRTMHPWERDARLIKESVSKGPQWYGVIVEIACTRTGEELLGARKAYHSLFDRSVEEDIAHRVSGPERNLLVALVSSYRYAGQKVHEENKKSEAKTIESVFKRSSDDDLVKDEDVVRILSTRSKPHLKALFNHYEKSSGRHINEDLKLGNEILRETIECLISPQTYFSKVIDRALNVKEEEHIKDALTRVLVTRADTDIKEIKEEYKRLFGIELPLKLEEATHGTYKEFLLALIARENES